MIKNNPIFVLLLFCLAVSCANVENKEFQRVSYYPDLNKLNGARHLGGPINLPKVEFPPKELKERVEGWVLFMFDVNENGIPSNIRKMKSHPNDNFVQPASLYLSNARFSPYKVAGENQSVLNHFILVDFIGDSEAKNGYYIYTMQSIPPKINVNDIIGPVIDAIGDSGIQSETDKSDTQR